MNIIGIDLGNKSRNGISVMSDTDYSLLDYCYLAYGKEYSNPLDYRNKIVDKIEEFISKYSVEYILYEKINLFRGGRTSPLANIISMCKLQTTIINRLSDKVNICETDVRSWKSKVLGSGNADKDAAIDKVRLYYPYVNLEIKVEHKRKKETEIVINHDLADSIMIARAGIVAGTKWLDERKVNYE